ncbi:hypothetical protein KFL_005580020 [Klebsormidium nitens]|uniref:Sec-independent protein translocase protein TatB n=1 Tax=Klebsormidium nitens TaxID=105231 RepID=A0A0U9HMD5_KLENI|nr:hypothetical protein KFL_005580020 [Klebsormidium nitens]|eukprot:GAQ89750.1 hypothetical protein KFL_005580020 [Klebsormidium nitens]
MIFGISYGELAAILVVGAVAFGPKDLPVIARAAGRLTGQAVGYVSALRSRAQTFAEKTQLDELHKELQQTMSQLEAIRYEIRTGANILVPGSMTNRLATRAVEAANARVGGAGNAQTTVTASSVSVESTEPPASASMASPDSPSTSMSSHFQQQTVSRLVTSNAASQDLPDLTSLSAQSTVSAKSVGVGSLGLKHAQELLDRRREGVPTAGTTGNTGFETLPISAVSAGLLPRRADGASGGADILSDAIVERQISLQANDFIRNMSKPPENPR